MSPRNQSPGNDEPVSPDEPITQKPPSYSLLHKIVLACLALTLIATMVLSIWYFSARHALPCGGSARNSWQLELTDVPGGVHLQWYIKPTAGEAFVNCLADRGFDIKMNDTIITATRNNQSITNASGMMWTNSDGRFVLRTW